MGDIYHDFVSGEVMNCLCMSLMIFIDSLFHKKIKKIAARPHAMEAAKCLRNRLFYYHGLIIQYHCHELSDLRECYVLMQHNV